MAKKATKTSRRVDPGARGRRQDVPRHPRPDEPRDEVVDRGLSQEYTGTTKPHGLAGPNARLRPAKTSDVTGGEGIRSQSRGRPGATSDAERARNERRLPAANAHPRAAATSTAPVVATDLGRRRLKKGEDPGGRTPATIRVRALVMGYYDHLRRRPGDVFELHFEEDYSNRWMEEVDPDTPLSTTLGQEDLNQQHDELLAARHSERTAGRSVARTSATSVERQRREQREARARGDAAPRTLSQAQRAQQGIQTGRDDVGDVPTGTDNPLGAEED